MSHRSPFPLRSGLIAVFMAIFLSPASATEVGPSSTAPIPENLIVATSGPGAVALAHAGHIVPLAVSNTDFPGVVRAARDLQADFTRVTGVTPSLETATVPASDTAILIGTLGQSALIDGLVKAGKLNADTIRGRWEAFQIEMVPHPLPGVERALVIVGSDKRGTIYGIYEISRQIGVSPWYWWADVPVKHQSELFVRSGKFVDRGPVVKYRGIFLNDEAPALSGWTKEKFGGFNHKFYVKVFELLLRLRGNYLWPAMWGSAFNDDDPLNPKLADEYGIVMGTSHHEPLMRAHAEWARYGNGPWDYSKNAAVLREFWRGGVERNKDYENIETIGMRGDGDEAMSAETNTALLEQIVADQRKILTEVTHKPITEIPQLWALYKEVQSYYEKGMRVPDDVTLLWCDDNWGNIRRLPTTAETKRSGGAGIYYHFDYVGGPRNYKWLNTIPLTKIQEQMNLAWQYDANRIWIVNVGDLKPMEFPIEFFLTMAWDPAQLPADKLTAYSEKWAAENFGPAHATEIAALINGYTKLNSRRKPEMLAPDTYSLVNYHEAERVLAEWQTLTTRAEALNAALAPEYRDAFFQLVLYPIKACANLQELYVAAGLNRLYARQGRTATNAEAARVRQAFAEDGKLVAQYHALDGGKWDHMMDQIKLGYTIWQQPDIETMPAVSEVRPRREASMAVTIEGSETAWPSTGARSAVLPKLDSTTAETRWIDVFNRGTSPFTFQATAHQPWLKLTPANGTVDQSTRLAVSVDWAEAPEGETKATLTIDGSTGERATIQLPLRKTILPANAIGFVESNRTIAIEAPHFSRAIDEGKNTWRVLPDFGRTLGGVTSFPVKAPAIVPGGHSPHLEYDVYLTSSGEISVELQCAPSLDFQPGDGLQLAVSFDDAAPQIVKLDTWATLHTWERSVGDGVRRVAINQSLATPGHHVFKFWLVTPGVVLERIILNAGGVRPSYLGPPESTHLP
ncbi:MAG: glycosyl hydrolase 115 family protein [Lacunisphaera sp.]